MFNVQTIAQSLRRLAPGLVFLRLKSGACNCLAYAASNNGKFKERVLIVWRQWLLPHRLMAGFDIEAFFLIGHPFRVGQYLLTRIVPKQL